MIHYTYRCEHVWCGKNCGGCPHGPYWYGYYRQRGRLRKRYFGKGYPYMVDASGARLTDTNPHDAIFDPLAKNKRLVAAAILWLPEQCSNEEIRAAFVKLTKSHHPDVGGDSLVYARILAAYSYLTSCSVA